jgi:hypothetical protein
LRRSFSFATPLNWWEYQLFPSLIDQANLRYGHFAGVRDIKGAYPNLLLGTLLAGLSGGRCPRSADQVLSFLEQIQQGVGFTGLPQGYYESDFLFQFAMRMLDEWASSNNVGYNRLQDDFVVLGPSEADVNIDLSRVGEELRKIGYEFSKEKGSMETPQRRGLYRYRILFGGIPIEEYIDNWDEFEQQFVSANLRPASASSGSYVDSVASCRSLSNFDLERLYEDHFTPKVLKRRRGPAYPDQNTLKFIFGRMAEFFPAKFSNDVKEHVARDPSIGSWIELSDSSQHSVLRWLGSRSARSRMDYPETVRSIAVRSSRHIDDQTEQLRQEVLKRAFRASSLPERPEQVSAALLALGGPRLLSDLPAMPVQSIPLATTMGYVAAREDGQQRRRLNNHIPKLLSNKHLMECVEAGSFASERNEL